MSDKATSPKCPVCGSSQIQRSSPKLLKSLEPPQSYRCENGHSFIVRGDDMAAASRLVDEAMADADYARVKAPTEQAKKEALQLKTDIQALRDQVKQMTSPQ